MGNGLVNATRVFSTKSTVDTTRIHLNDTKNFQPLHEITLTNNEAVAVSYNFSLEPAAGFEVQNPYVANFETWGINIFSDLVPKNMVPDVSLPGPLKLGPGESKKIT